MAKEEVFELYKQMYAYNAICSIVWLITFCIVSAITISLSRKIENLYWNFKYKQWNKEYEKEHDKH